MKKYKESNKAEIETTINVLYAENILSIYTNKTVSFLPVAFKIKKMFTFAKKRLRQK